MLVILLNKTICDTNILIIIPGPIGGLGNSGVLPIYLHTLDKCWGTIQSNIIVLTAGIAHTCLEDSGIVKIKVVCFCYITKCSLRKKILFIKSSCISADELGSPTDLGARQQAAH